MISNHSYRRLLNVLASAFMAASMCCAGTAAIIHVPADYPTIQAALDAAASGDEVVVAPGTYSGWVAGGALQNVTLRSSDGPATTIINGAGAWRGIGSLNNTTQGFTFTGSGSGIGLFPSDDSTTEDCVFAGFETAIVTGNFNGPDVVRNCTFDGNGRGIHSVTELTVSDCTFRNHTIRALDSGFGDLVVTDCLFENNSADTSAAILINGAAAIATITNTDFVGNAATAGDSGAVGGGSNNAITISGCTFTGNSAAGNGGAIATGVGTITLCTFNGNSANSGGALHLTGNAAANQCTVTENHATTSGGGVWIDGNATLTQGAIDNNTTDGDGGGIACLGGVMSQCTITNNVALGSGGGVHTPETTAELMNCELSFNTAANGGGLSVESGATLVATDSILCDNMPDEVAFEGGFIAVNVTTCSSQVAVGACCLPQGGCALLTESDCMAVGGTYSGDETDCAMADCPPACSGDTNSDGVVDVIDLLNVLAAWGSCL